MSGKSRSKSKPKTLAVEKNTEVASVSQTIGLTKSSKPRRGRPKGQSDSKPRKPRSDAGRKRGSYKK